MSEHNSLLGLKIMDILREHTNINHGLSQQEIVELLEDEYETEVDRKTVGRNLKLLLEYDDERHIGYETLKRTQNGKENPIRTNFYYKSDFEIGEMQVVLDSILSNRHISMKHTKDLIERICGNHKEFKTQWIRSIAFYDTYYKRDIQDLFLNLEKILDAIEEKRDISICVCECDENLKLVEGRKLRVSPVQLFMYEQTYYLLVIRNTASLKGESGMTRRIDVFPVEDLKIYKMYDTKNNAQEEFKKLQPGASFAKLLETFPYMEFRGAKKVETMTFVIPKCYLKDVVARFANNIRFKEIPNSKSVNNSIWRDALVKVSVKTTRPAMERFMQEHRDHLYMLDPISMNWEYYIEKRRQEFEKAVKEHVFTGKDQERLRESVHSDWYLFKQRVDSSEDLTVEEKRQMNQMLRKMLDPKWNKKKDI